MLIPFGMIFKKVAGKKRDRNTLLIVLIVCILSSIGLVYLINDSIIQYTIFYVILVNFTYFLESASNSLMSKQSPKQWEKRTVNTGFIISISTTFGRALGSLMITFVGKVFGSEYTNMITYSTSAILLLILTISSLIFWKDLRVKAFSKV